MDRKNALRIWEAAYGKVVEATDFSGRKINKSAYEQRNSKFGWVVTYLLPKSEGGKDNPDNLICLHSETALEKGDNFPFFTVNDKKYVLTNVEGSGWVIEEALDSESIAEQEAKNAAAIEKWEQLFGPVYEKAIDFCGREIYKSEYNTDSEYAWKVAPYVDSKPAENKNVYIAHVLSIEEALGRTAFKANGRNYTLNKDNGAYFFKPIEIKPKTEPKVEQEAAPEPVLMIRPKIKKGLKLRLNVRPAPEPEPMPEPAPEPIAEEPAPEPEPPKKVFSVTNAYDVAARVSEIKTAVGADENAMVDFIVVRAVTVPGFTAVAAQSVVDTVSMILKESAGEYLAAEVSDMADEQGARYMFITYRFETPSPTEFERVFAAARVLNTYSLMLTQSLGLSEIKIYNYASFVNRTQLHYPVSLLSAFNPQFKELMDGVYSGSFDYPGIAATTLFVSHFIVFNVPELAAAHPEGATPYVSAAEMVEHNAFDPDVAGSLFRLLSGEPETPEEKVAETVAEAPAEEAAAEVEAPTEAPAEEVAAEVEAPTEAPAEEAAAEVEAPVNETPDEASVEETVAPVTDETVAEEATDVAEEPNANLANKLTSTLMSALSSTPAEAEEQTVEPEPEAVNNTASAMASALASSLAYTEEAPAAEEAPVTEEPPEVPAVDEAPEAPAIEEASVTEEAPVVEEAVCLPDKTPEGEQLKMAFPLPEAQDEDGVLTLDLDSLD